MRCNVCRCREHQRVTWTCRTIRSTQINIKKCAESPRRSTRACVPEATQANPSPRKNISSSSSINKRRKPTNAGIDKRCGLRFGKEAMRSRENARKEAEKNRKGPEANQIEVVHRKSMRSGEKLASKTYDPKAPKTRKRSQMRAALTRRDRPRLPETGKPPHRTRSQDDEKSRIDLDRGTKARRGMRP